MEIAVQRLQLQREVVLVSHHTGIDFAVFRGRFGASSSRPCRLLRPHDRRANFAKRMAFAVIRKVATQESPNAVHHVTARATGFAKIKFLPHFRIPNNRRSRALSLQGPYVTQQSGKLGSSKSRKG